MPQKIVLSDQSLKKLVKEVRKRECLWNPNHDRYNDRYQMAKAWMEIAQLMQLPEERLRVKWKNLRDLFKKEIRKYGSAEEYTGKWRHFDMIKFINIPDITNKRLSNILKTTNETDGASVEAKEEIEDDDEYEYEVEEQEQGEENNEVEVYLDETYEEDPIPDKIAKMSTDEDYDVMFLKSLAPYFKQLDPIRKLVVRSKMQDMLLNEIAAQTSASQLHAKKS